MSGAPAAGKSSVAGPLAAALGLPLLAKDDISEALLDSLGGPCDLERSRRLGRAALDLMLVLAGGFPGAVLEANFRPRHPAQRRGLAALGPGLVEVHCRCPGDEAARRYRARARAGGRHRVHVLAELTPELLAEFEGPVGLGPVLEVDTTSPVDVGALALRVGAALGRT